MARVGGAVTVTIPQGTLRGRKAKAPSGRPYSAFQAIPYALPPVGRLRLKASSLKNYIYYDQSPEPPEKWSWIRNATIEPNVAPQINVFLDNQDKGDEACLYLNVYTPKLPTGASAKLIPVLVWIHGRAFMLGSGNTDYYGRELLLEHDVVLVTLNYRVGALGFLSTGDEVIPGNAGLKDQVMALKWVKSNIANFGGDPQNVTIFGESAGAVSCRASHGDDVAYLFYGQLFKDIPKGPETVEGKAIARITRMWTNFATKRNPTPDPEDPILSVTWTPFKKDSRCYLNITKDHKGQAP
ncbi:juvenile hormone esterase-like [Schistocerca nitens]|uniref:juvenile hormone esterase-like n=1 Tax=Schistocerca nitens TaxID=7011 RepID=UPI0021184E03|nr:juvenile hormone esterase-like [Schistocerca nitens]